MIRRPLDMQNRMLRVPWRRLDAAQDCGSQLPRRELLAKEPVTCALIYIGSLLRSPLPKLHSYGFIKAVYPAQR